MLDFTLTTSELAELKKHHKRCKKRTEADRMKAVYLLGKGWSVVQVAEALLLEDDAIRRYFQQYKKGGLMGLLAMNHSGRSAFLSDEELSRLDAHLQEHTYRTVAEIIAYVRQEFDVEYSDAGVRMILARLNFVYRKPQKIPYRVDEKQQRNFIRRYQAIKNRLKPGDGLYFADVTHPEHTAITACGWMKRGEIKVVKSNPRPYRLNIQGAINMGDFKMVVGFEEKIGTESTLDLLETLRKRQPQGRLYLIVDNAAYYRSLDVKTYAKMLGITLVYLPPYSPNLNLIERVWKFFRQQVLYNRYYEGFADMIDACKQFFKKIGQHHDELQTLLTENFQILRL
jgi:transposase